MDIIFRYAKYLDDDFHAIHNIILCRKLLEPLNSKCLLTKTFLYNFSASACCVALSKCKPEWQIQFSFLLLHHIFYSKCFTRALYVRGESLWYLRNWIDASNMNNVIASVCYCLELYASNFSSLENVQLLLLLNYYLCDVCTKIYCAGFRFIFAIVFNRKVLCDECDVEYYSRTSYDKCHMLWMSTLLYATLDNLLFSELNILISHLWSYGFIAVTWMVWFIDCRLSTEVNQIQTDVE